MSAAGRLGRSCSGTPCRRGASQTAKGLAALTDFWSAAARLKRFARRTAVLSAGRLALLGPLGRSLSTSACGGLP